MATDMARNGLRRLILNPRVTGFGLKALEYTTFGLKALEYETFRLEAPEHETFWLKAPEYETFRLKVLEYETFVSSGLWAYRRKKSCTL